MAGDSRIVLGRRMGWSEERPGGLRVAWIGREASVRELMRVLLASPVPDAGALARVAGGLPGHWGLLAQGPDWVLALGDKVCGYPVFYAGQGEGLLVSNDARALAEALELREPDADAVLELKMTGYVTGADTLFQGLRRLRAGEMLDLRAGDASPRLTRYFEFYDPAVRQVSEAELVDELDAVTDAIVLRNMADAGGRTIWVPLSGGLDSRLVLCKLKQHGYDDIRTYSYGTPGNWDALRAGEIAARLGLPWQTLYTSPAEARAFFQSPARREYWELADGLHLVPNLHGMFALQRLVDSGQMQPGDVVVNGQSGDFIAGQHIPALAPGGDVREALFQSILGKHYNMRASLLRDPACSRLARRRIAGVLGQRAHPATEPEFAKAYELWEWQERQAKRVVNGQRNYDFFGLRWELPLWEEEYLKFWRDLPVEHKRGRRLFVRYVESRDFYGLFRDYKPFMSRWPKGRGMVQTVGRALKLLCGAKVSAAYYRRMDLHSQYRYLMACVPRGEYRRHCSDYKGAIPYYTDVWLAENVPGDR